MTSCDACVTITSLRASSRSVMTPAKSPNSMKGRKVASARRPTATGSSVSWSMNQPSAKRCIHEPTWETAWPAKKRR